MSDILIRPLQEANFERWEPWFAGYCDFYELLTQKSNEVSRALYDPYGAATDFSFYVSPASA